MTLPRQVVPHQTTPGGVDSKFSREGWPTRSQSPQNCDFGSSQDRLSHDCQSVDQHYQGSQDQGFSTFTLSGDRFRLQNAPRVMVEQLDNCQSLGNNFGGEKSGQVHTERTLARVVDEPTRFDVSTYDKHFRRSQTPSMFHKCSDKPLSRVGAPRRGSQFPPPRLPTREEESNRWPLQGIHSEEQLG